jgi:hypothetical protein
MDLVLELSSCVISLKLTERGRQSRSDKQELLGKTHKTYFTTTVKSKKVKLSP